MPNTVFKFFFEKSHTVLLEPEKLVLGAHFPPISVVFIGPIVFKKNRVHSWVDSHQLCEFHEHQFKTATCVVRSYTQIQYIVYTYISTYILTLRICQGPPKRKT